VVSVVHAVGATLCQADRRVHDDDARAMLALMDWPPPRPPPETSARSPRARPL